MHSLVWLCVCCVWLCVHFVNANTQWLVTTWHLAHNLPGTQLSSPHQFLLAPLVALVSITSLHYYREFILGS